MRKRVLTIPSCLLFALVACFFEATAQERVPIQADLVRAIEAGRVKVGEAVLAKVVVKWQSPQCTLRQGAILKGRIVAQSVHSKIEKTSEIALLFDSGQCDGREMKPLLLTVAALLGSDPAQDKNQYENQPLSDAVGLGLGSDPGPNGTAGSLSGKRSVTQAAATVYVSPPRYKGPTAVMPGQVVGIRGMKLNVGSGPEGSSVLSISGHNVRLESGAQFLLVANLNAPASAATTVTPAATALLPATASSTPPTNDVAPAADETEVCLPPQCNVALTPNEAEPGAAAASATLSVKDLGYVPERADHEMYSFDYGSAIAYLGQRELLFTFNPHVLIRREGTEAKFSKLRVIRAVLMNVQERRVERTLDWKVPDAQQYLWPMGQDAVLVHVGRELRLYGPGLKLQQRLALDGSLRIRAHVSLVQVFCGRRDSGTSFRSGTPAIGGGRTARA